MPWCRPSRRHTLSFARTSQIVIIRRNNVEPGILVPENTFDSHAPPTNANSMPVPNRPRPRRPRPIELIFIPVDRRSREIPCWWRHLGARVLRHNGQRSGLSPSTSTSSKVLAMLGAVWS